MTSRALPWADRLPVGWSAQRLRFVSTLNPSKTEVRGLPPDQSVSFVPMDSVGEWGGLRLEETRALSEVQAGFTYFRDGDVVTAKVTPCFENGKGALAEGLVGGVAFGTTELHVLRAGPRLDRRFLYYLTQTYPFRSIGTSEMYGAGGQRRVPEWHFRDFVAPLPPLAVQNAIADFLDRKTAAIDALIEKKERLAALLGEKRRALVGHAVVQGLSAGATRKASRIAWAGEVPSHWRILPIKRLARKGPRTFTDGDWIESPFITDSGVRLIQTGNVGVGVYKEQGFRYVSEATFAELRCSEVLPGDVLICRLDGPVGRACVVPDLGARMITSVDNAILKVGREHDARYIVYLLSMPEYLNWVQALCRVGGGFRFRISRSMLGDFRVPVPPKDEQTAIANSIDELSKPLLAAERCLRESQARLQEFRQALITTAVTGQLDATKDAA